PRTNGAHARSGGQRRHRRVHVGALRGRGQGALGSVWSALFELCAAALGATRAGPRRTLIVVAAYALCVLTIAVVTLAWGARGLVVMGAVGLLLVLAARDVLSARAAVWRAANGALNDPAQAPREVTDERFSAWTTVALRRLATAIDDARRARFVE